MNDDTSTCGKVNAATSKLLDTYVQQLIKKGQQHLGSGNFASVFQHPTYANMVVRVADVGDAGNVWLEVCAQQRFNPWLPQVAEITTANLESEDRPHWIQVSFIEKTRELSLGRLAPSMRPFTSVLGVYAGSPLPLSKNSKDALLRLAAKYVPGDKDLITALNLISKGPSGHPGMHLDLVPSNLRMRGRQVVFSDPWWAQNFVAH